MTIIILVLLHKGDDSFIKIFKLVSLLLAKMADANTAEDSTLCIMYD